MRRLVAAGVVTAGCAGFVRGLVRGSLTIDSGTGRTVRPLGPVSWSIDAPPEVVFDVIAAPYLGRTPRSLSEKLVVWERSPEMVLAAHHTHLRSGVTTTLETVRFERPTRVSFRLVRGPVPHVMETFELQPDGGGTTLDVAG